MFSFHKPKVYRSPTGCCICRAKSSSSRFTDSKKYEDDFMDCFQLKDRRAGEICNACVLLVKRWKKLPEGSERNWQHVVDARAGPGTKSLTKFKSKNKKKLKLSAEMILKLEVKKKHIYIKSDRIVREQSPGACSDDIMGEDFLSDLSGPSLASSLAPSPTPFDNTAMLLGNRNRVKAKSPLRCETITKPRLTEPPALSSFLDLDYWKREKVCCGFIFRGLHGEVMVDPRFLVPCAGCSKNDQLTSSQGSSATKPDGTGLNSMPDDKVAVVTSNGLAKSFSDSSSDSGYDESSNQGAGEASHARSGTSVSVNPLTEFAVHAAKQCQVPAPAN